MDILQYTDDIKGVQCMNGVVWKMPNGITLFGNYTDFLYSHQIMPVRSKASSKQHSYHTIISKFSVCSEKQVKFTLKSMSIHAVTFSEAFKVLEVKRNLEKMFSVDSCVSSFEEEENISVYDRRKTDNSYYVNLPWHENEED